MCPAGHHERRDSALPVVIEVVTGAQEAPELSFFTRSLSPAKGLSQDLHCLNRPAATYYRRQGTLRGQTMVLGLVAALLLIGYQIYVLLNPERF